MKTCAKCKIDKPEEDFTPWRNGLYSYCRDCAAKIQAEYRATKPAEWHEQKRIQVKATMKKIRDAYLTRLNSLKSERPCFDCGSIFSPSAMEFDHLRDKKFELTKGYKYSWDEVRQEIDKCQLVCANCHRIRTDSRRK